MVLLGIGELPQHIVQVVVDHQMLTMRTADDAIQLQATGSRLGMSKDNQFLRLIANGRMICSDWSLSMGSSTVA